MSKVNITEAAKLAGITRQYLHKKYIKTGLITVHRDTDHKPLIDTSEILRVFGSLQDDSSHEVKSIPVITLENDSKITFLEEKFQLLREQLTAAQEREKIANERENRLMNQIDQLTTTIRLLEHKPVESPPTTPHPPVNMEKIIEPEPQQKRKWWKFYWNRHN